MKRLTPRTAILAAALMGGGFTFSAPATAQATMAVGAISAPLPQFEPRPSKRTRITYDVWSDILGEIVLYMGPSTRKRYTPGPPEIGTRISRTHNSPFRMEGNKVLYPNMNDEYLAALKDYVDELEVLGNQLDISSLPRNEQLAYWLNLHNATVLHYVSANYPGPARQPRKIKPVAGSDLTLHDAPLLAIDGNPLSLRDIRERIVYPNWQNKDVPLSFYLGDSSGPSLPNIAFNGTDLRGQLKNNAEEYTNSLRGMWDGKVSLVFYDVAQWYFPNFETDLTQYFETRMRPEVMAEFNKTSLKGPNRYDYVINDITGGNGERGRIPLNFAQSSEDLQLGRDVVQFLVRRTEKINRLRQNDWFKRGTVTIIDIETEDTSDVK